METKTRSLLKSVIWSLIGLMVMAAVGYVATGSLVTGGAMALVNAMIGFLTYLIYERIWAGIRWGRL
ncbi:MAG: DUF2061 domain-containing protein [Pseudomonadota bacterium]